MASTFLVLRTNDTAPQLYFHNGFTIDGAGLGTLPGATLESLTGFGGVRNDVKQNNRVFTFLNMVFVIQNGVVYVSIDEGASFTADFTFTGVTNTWYAQVVGPVPVMVGGVLHLIGFYLSGVDLFLFDYDFAGDLWSDTDTGINVTSGVTGATTPVVLNNMVYARVGDVWVVHDPILSNTATLVSTLTNFGSDHAILWNGGLWAGPYTAGAPSHAGMAQLVGGALDIDTVGADFGKGALDIPLQTSKAGVFVDPITTNLIVMWTSSNGNFFVHRITSLLVVTDITVTVAGPSLVALGKFGPSPRFWPHITRSPGGSYGVTIYASRGPEPTDPIEKFQWVHDATQITEEGIVGGTGAIAFPYATHGGDYNGFFPGEKRLTQTAQSVNPDGVTITCKVFQNGASTLSVRGHYDDLSIDANNLTLSPMTIGNPTGTVGLALSGVNPGAQIDGVPADRTPISFDWDQTADGFSSGDPYNYQLEVL